MLKLRAALWVALPLALSACAPRTSANNGVPNGADPEKVSRAEYDLASDDWKHGRLRGAMEHALKASAADEGHAEAHHFVAILYMALCQTEGDCRWEEAEKYARKAVAADAEFRPARHTLGVILIQEKKYDEAIGVLRPLAEDILYKTPELAWYDLGGAYLEKGDADQAIDALSKAIALKPTFCWANFRLGLAFEKKGLWEKAEDELTRAVEPEEPQCKNLQDAYQARARVRAKVGKKDLAKQDLQVCTNLSPATPAGRSCSASLKTM
ncbi:MAG: tetratricopeptide repeat protein [Polyangiales bacterium]